MSRRRRCIRQESRLAAGRAPRRHSSLRKDPVRAAGCSPSAACRPKFRRRCASIALIKDGVVGADRPVLDAIEIGEAQKRVRLLTGSVLAIARRMMNSDVRLCKREFRVPASTPNRAIKSYHCGNAKKLCCRSFANIPSNPGGNRRKSGFLYSGIDQCYPEWGNGWLTSCEF